MQATAIPAPSRVSGRPLLTPGATATRLAVFAAITLLPAIGALAVEWALWSFLRPFAWFAFFPAVFTSAWLGGWRAGVGAGLFSTPRAGSSCTTRRRGPCSRPGRAWGTPSRTS